MKTFIRILQYLWVPASIGLFMIFYDFGEFPTGEKGAEWFTALALLTAFSLSVLIIHFYNSREFDSYKIKVDSNNEEIDKLKELASLSSFLFDVTTDEAFGNHNSWQENYSRIKRLYHFDLIDDKTLRRISTIAWKQGSANYAFELRKLAYKKNPKDFYNRSYLASSSQFISSDLLKKSKLDNEKKFLKLLDFEHSYDYEGASSMALAVKGRFYAQRNDYLKAKTFFEKAIEYDYSLWHYKGYLITLIALGDINGLETETEKLKNETNCIYNENKYESHIIFRKLMETIIELKKGTNNVNEFYKLFYPENVAKFSILTSYEKGSYFNIYNNLKNQKADPILVRMYMTYYFYLGADDKAADELIRTSREKNNLFSVIENVTKYWN